MLGLEGRRKESLDEMKHPKASRISIGAILEHSTYTSSESHLPL
jgi:hypothetical protein